MSYRNPRIIDNSRGSAVTDALIKGAATLAQGFARGAAAKQKTQEEEDRKKKEDDGFLIKLRNESAADAAMFNDRYLGTGENISKVLTESHQATLDEIDEIKIKQRNGDTNILLSKQLATLDQKIKDDNSFSESVIGSVGELSDLMDDPEAFGTTVFFTEDENGSTDRSEALVRGFGGDPEFMSEIINRDGKLYAVAWRAGDENNKFEIPASEFATLSNNLTMEMPEIVNNAGDFNKNNTFAKRENGKLDTSKVQDKFELKNLEGEAEEPTQSSTRTKDANGNNTLELKVTTSTPLNNLAVEDALNANFYEIKSDLDAFDVNKQGHDILLDQLRIDKEIWKTATQAQRMRHLKEKTDNMYLEQTKISKDEQDNYVLNTVETKQNEPFTSTEIFSRDYAKYNGEITGQNLVEELGGNSATRKKNGINRNVKSMSYDKSSNSIVIKAGKDGIEDITIPIVLEGDGSSNFRNILTDLLMSQVGGKQAIMLADSIINNMKKDQKKT